MLELLLNKEFEFREQNSFRKRKALAPIKVKIIFYRFSR